MFFAGTASALIGIPPGQLDPAPAGKIGLNDVESIANRLSRLVEVLENGSETLPFSRFYDASAGSTQRISTRSVRFRFYRWAIEGGRPPEFSR